MISGILGHLGISYHCLKFLTGVYLDLPLLALYLPGQVLLVQNFQFCPQAANLMDDAVLLIIGVMVFIMELFIF